MASMMAESVSQTFTSVDTLEYRIFCAARDNMPLTLFALLWQKSKQHISKILCHLTDEDGQKTTPLIISCKNGHEKVVHLLLKFYDVSVEQVGTVKFDGFIIEGATPLWCSSGAGHFPIIKILLDYGAKVNQPTMTNSTPLRAACFDGQLDIVKYLVQRGANIHIANMYQNTCLMIASYKGHEPVVQYLLESGANPNMKAHCGTTALHFAAEMGFLNIVRLLSKYSAMIQTNEQGLTPIHIAAEANRAEDVEFFISQPLGDGHKGKRVEALELLGASYANDKDHYNIEKCYRYLWLAMHERYSDADNMLHKKLLPPVEAYENHIECQTIEELEALHGDDDSLHIEALVIRERILGEDNIEIPHPIIFRGAVYADAGQFDRCTSLWHRVLNLNLKNNRSIAKDLIRFAQVFSQMIRSGVELEFTFTLKILSNMVDELARDISGAAYTTSCSDELVLYINDLRYNREMIHELNIHTAMYLLYIIHQMKHTDSQHEELCRLVYRFNKLHLHLSNDFTPLHMVCDEETIVDDFHVNDIVHFPSHSLLRLLIHCGADVNAVDSAGNTPLHTIVQYNRPISDFLTLHDVIVSLIEAGCHGDQVNHEEKTPSEYSTTGVSEIILRTQWKFTLKCIAAQKVKRSGIDYKDKLPTVIREFVDAH